MLFLQSYKLQKSAGIEQTVIQSFYFATMSRKFCNLVIAHTSLTQTSSSYIRRVLGEENDTRHDQMMIDVSRLLKFYQKHRIDQLAASLQIPKTDVEISYCECYKIRSYPLDRPGVIREILDCCYSFSAPCMTIMQSYDFSTYVGIFNERI